jgi:hypothetical protein
MTASSHNTTETSVMPRRPTPHEIAARAYEIFRERGCQPGHEMDDWLQAEYELMQLPIRKLAELKPAKPASKRAKRSIIEIVRAAMY